MASYTPPATLATAQKYHPQIFTVHIALPHNTKNTQKTAGTVIMFLWSLCQAVAGVVVVAVAVVVAVKTVAVVIGSGSGKGIGG
jgi:hypothetical protein